MEINNIISEEELLAEQLNDYFRLDSRRYDNTEGSEGNADN